ncbi:MAG: disulfide bond formation protein B [Burkholderiales bacterium]|nr:disulfide bond formation protein B [Burkholderiales bacterium]
MSLTRLLSPRILLAAMFVACAGLLAYGLYLQHAVGLQPCPMCILQRYAFVVLGLIAMVGMIHGPQRTGLRLYGALIGLTAIAGGSVAIRQTWLQHNPPAIAECGPGLEYMLESFPLTEAWPMIFQGSGDCSKVDWTFIGLSIAEWSLVCFIGFLIGAVLVVLGSRRTAAGK